MQKNDRYNAYDGVRIRAFESFELPLYSIDEGEGFKVTKKKLKAFKSS